MRLGHVAFQVRDLDEIVAFYVEVVGLQVSEIGRGAGRATAPRIAFLSWDPVAVHHQLAIAETLGDLPPRNIGHVAFEVDALADLRPIWKRVRADGRAGGLWPADTPVTAFMGDQWSIRFADPEANGIEIYAPTPWDTVAAAVPYSRTPGIVFDPFDLDLDDDALVGWGTKQLAALQIEYWPRGDRRWPASVERRAIKST
jgi:catechol 2,3-dioxygenase-like lactoylglutathione lyase family enzyme